MLASEYPEVMTSLPRALCPTVTRRLETPVMQPVWLRDLVGSVIVLGLLVADLSLPFEHCYSIRAITHTVRFTL